MKEYYLDVTVRVRVRTDGDPEEVIQECDYNFKPSVGEVVETEITDVEVVSTVDPQSGALVDTDDDTDAETGPIFRNFYRCSECGHEWQDEWSCGCNDRCPKCRTEIEPYRSEEIKDGQED